MESFSIDQWREQAIASNADAQSDASQQKPTKWRATYRVQVHKGFTFDDVAAVTEYLAALGVSHLYSSPMLQAVAGSTHGYDVVDPHSVSSDLGGETALMRLGSSLDRNSLGLLLDIVPNHMSIGGPENHLWWDVLENGSSSRYAGYFDIEWNPPEAGMLHRILLPVLGERYGAALQDRRIQLRRQAGIFTVSYAEQHFPVSPRSLARVLALAAGRCESAELAFLADASTLLLPATAMVRDQAALARNRRDAAVLRGLLTDLFAREPEVAATVDAVTRETSETPELLDTLLEDQSYRLASWRTADQDLNYRRFFDINSLVGLRVTDPRVFADTHQLILSWVDQGLLDGVRLDHIDGLRDPDAYLALLRERAPHLGIWVEKILGRGEQLPARWPVTGTTGYDFLNVATGVFIDPAAEEPLTELYAEFITSDRAATAYADIVYQNKLQMLRGSLGSDVNRLTALLLDLCGEYWSARDFTRHELREALRELIACFPVYRTYLRAEAGVQRPEDRRITEEAINGARSRQPTLDSRIFDFLLHILTLQFTGSLAAEFVMRFQQLTGPAMAKGVEDTTFYGYNRLIALNEVGGDPDIFGHSVQDFHDHCQMIQDHWPETLLATSTHDTKRSEDVRARLAVLTEIPHQWRAAVLTWAQCNAHHKTEGWPDANSEYLLYQTLVGAWPIDSERACAYMLKAAREARVHTSWTEQNAQYEEALARFVQAVLEDTHFVERLAALVVTICDAGWRNALGQTLLKFTAPGIPDIYQGTELWDLSLVDPDNRRPVDYALRRRFLEELDRLAPEQIWDRRDQGLPKLWVVRQALAVRRSDPGSFGTTGDYRPLTASGVYAESLVAFARGKRVLSVVPRYGLQAQGDWGDTTLEVPDRSWHNALTAETFRGPTLKAADLLRRFPVALLTQE